VDGTPGPLAALYYRQRSSAGLIITEATQISRFGQGYIRTPGIYLPQHVAAWRKITAAVHEAGGRIFLQLWHVGRISHRSLLPDQQPPVAPSAIRARAQTFIETGPVETSEPRALSRDEIRETIRSYAAAAKAARQAEFDGVEIHAANGYLIDQFIQSGTNQRTDEYGGSVPNRLRLLKEVTDAVCAAWDAACVGVRLSPRGTFNDMFDDDPLETFTEAAKALSGFDLAYLHVVEFSPGDPPPSDKERSIFTAMRRIWQGVFVVNGGYDKISGDAAVKEGAADAITFGRLFISNPDLPQRFARDCALTAPDPAFFYGGDERGYTDYPACSEMAIA
jgi:N-ethylmaleimide reductase